MSAPRATTGELLRCPSTGHVYLVAKADVETCPTCDAVLVPYVSQPFTEQQQRNKKETK